MNLLRQLVGLKEAKTTITTADIIKELEHPSEGQHYWGQYKMGYDEEFNSDPVSKLHSDPTVKAALAAKYAALNKPKRFHLTVGRGHGGQVTVSLEKPGEFKFEIAVQRYTWDGIKLAEKILTVHVSGTELKPLCEEIDKKLIKAINGV